MKAMHDDYVPANNIKKSNDELLKEVKKTFKTLYWRRISNNLTASIGLLKKEDLRSQFLCLFVEDERTGMWINLRLSTMRKLFKFMDKKRFFKPRRLDEVEKMLLDRD